MIKPTDYAIAYQQALTRLKHASVERSPELQSLIRTTSDMFECPKAVLTLNDETQAHSPQLFISSVGLNETSIDSPDSFSRHIFLNQCPLIVPDATTDPRFANNPYVQRKEVRFCAGCPISLNGTDTIGALCIFDDKPRQLTSRQIEQLQRLTQVVEGLLRSNLNWIQAKLAFEEVEMARILSSRKEALFNELEKVSGVGGWEFDMETEDLVWTAQTRVIVGVDDDFVPCLDTGFAYFSPEARDIIEETVNKALVSDGIWASELPFINAKGKHMWVKTTGQGVYKDGKLRRLIGTFQDVSERKLLEQKMSENERLMQAKNNELSAIVAHIPQGVAVYDSRGLLKYWNDQHIRVYRKDPTKVQVRNAFRDFVRIRYEQQETRDTPDELMADMYAAFDAGKTLRKVYRLKTGQIVEALYSQLPDRGWICTSEDITEQEKNREKIHYAAHHDSLTGLANRTQFNDYVDHLTQDIRSENRCHMLMLIDLDFFKEVNDTYGHSAGDDVLKEVAHRLLNEVREGDLVCRFGGDEFAIVLTGSQGLKQEAETIARRIVQSVDQPFHSAGHTLTIGVSIGISWIDHQDKQLNAALKRADLALYAIKEHGRNGYRFYDDSLDKPTPC